MNWRTSSLSGMGLRSVSDLVKPLAPQLAVIVALLMTVGAAVVIARGDGSNQIARDATIHAAAESVISALTTLQADVRETLVIGDAAGVGLAGTREIGDVVANLRSSIEEADDRAATLLTIWPDAGFERAVGLMAREARAVAEDVEARDFGRAVQIADGALADGYVDVLGRAVEIRDSRARSIAAVQQGLDTVATAARVVSGLLNTCLVGLRLLPDHEEEPEGGPPQGRVEAGEGTEAQEGCVHSRCLSPHKHPAGRGGRLRRAVARSDPRLQRRGP